MRDDVNYLIGQRIKKILKSQGKSQVWLADEMDIKTGYLSELINCSAGKRWNADLMQSAVDALGIKFDDLAKESEEYKQITSSYTALSEQGKKDLEDFANYLLTKQDKK